MNKFIKTVTEDRVCYEFMNSLNGIIGLTERELQVFSVLLSMRLQDIKTKNPRLSIDRAENRKRIINEYRIGKENLSRYIKKYRKKGLIYTTKYGNNVIMDALLPQVVGGKTVQVTMILKINQDD